MDCVLGYQVEIHSVLTRIGALHATPAEVMSQEPEESADLSFDITGLSDLVEPDADEFTKVFNTKPEKKKVDKFWDEISTSYSYDLNNPEILTYEQAAKLGLTPEEEP
jgi:hypothetical protein